MDFALTEDLKLWLIGGGLLLLLVLMLLRFLFKGGGKHTPVEMSSDYRPFRLEEKLPITTGVRCPVYCFRFSLPPGKSLDLPVGHHLRLRAKVEGKDIVRPYTPTTTNAVKGCFDLVIKVYPDGKMTKYLHSLPIGSTVEMMKPMGRMEYKPGEWKKIGMIAGGTGITPMLQMIQEIVALEENSAQKTEMSLVFANVEYADIILKDRLDSLAAEHPNFRVHYVLDRPPENWDGSTGFVTKDIIKEHMPAPSPLDTELLICGPPMMMSALEDHFKDLGYDENQVFRF